MDRPQNQQVERMAKDAAAGKGYDWRKVPIGELPGAIDSCPYRSRGLPIPNWWNRIEPEFLKKQGREIARNVGLDFAYCAEPLSESLATTPEGYLIARNVVIGRTGFQTYKVNEVTDPENLIDDSEYGPNDDIRLWRDPSEVFSPKTIASFEGKSVTLHHPPDLLNPDSDTDYSIGHIQNVRKGKEPLDSGEWPLIADLIVKDSDAIEALKSGETELSCGYSYRLAKEGHRWDQREILGNHVAIVPKGRAGHEARVDTAGVNDRRGRDRRSGKERENVATR